MKKSKTHVIIGNSAAGIAAIESMRSVDNRSTIINISSQAERPYSRCLLSYYLAGQCGKEILWIRPDDYYSRLDVEPMLGVAVKALDAGKKTLELSDGKNIAFDKLLIATGASAKSLAVKGVDKTGVFVLRSLEDTEGILRLLPGVKKACILGGGLIGMRAAYALKRRGIAVHVIVKSPHIFSQMLDDEAADMMRRHLENNGIEISTGLEAKGIEGEDSVEGVLLDDGNTLDCQLIIVGKGAQPNLGIAKGQVKTSSGISVDEYLKTDREDIFAAGDVAEAYDVLEERANLNQIWPAAIRQGKIAGLNMAGEEVRYEGSCGMNSLDFFGLAVMSFGFVKPKGCDYEELIVMDTTRALYRKIVLKDKRIVGGVLINDVQRHGILLHLALQKIDISDVKDIVIDDHFDFGKVMPLIRRQAKNFVRPEHSDALSTYSPAWI